MQTIFERKFDITLLSEPHHNSRELGWITDTNNKASIIVKSIDLIQKKSEPSTQYYCWVKYTQLLHKSIPSNSRRCRGIMQRHKSYSYRWRL